MSSILTFHKGETKTLSFSTTGSFTGKEVEFRIGRRVSFREITELAVFPMTVAVGGASAAGDVLIDDEAVAASNYESQLVITNDADPADFEVIDGPLVTIKETI